MRWAWRAIALAGIPVYVHATFWLLLAFVGIQALRRPGGGIEDALSAIGFAVAIFVCVTLHEMGHALAARRCGIRTRDIILLPLGGVARLERMPEKPGQEIGVALAGPAVNVVIAIVLAAIIGVGRASTQVQEIEAASGSFLTQLLAINLFLAVFNLLPAFPMDGGRVLRALLATRLSYAQATMIAARVGQGMAIVFAVIGFGYLRNPFLLLIAFFVWSGAGQEARMVTAGFDPRSRGAGGGSPRPDAQEPRQERAQYEPPPLDRERVRPAGADQTKLESTVVSDVMLRDFRFLEADAPLADAAAIARSSPQNDFLIAESGRFLGVVDAGSLTREISERGPNVPLRSITRTGVVPAKPDEPVTDLLARMRKTGVRALPVLEGGRIVGIVSEGLVQELPG